MKKLNNYAIITLSILIMAIGIYFFKFPNGFTFGGVTGLAVVVAKLLPISASMFTFLINMALLVLGFIFLGKSFAIKTTYASTLLSVLLVVFEHTFPLSAPLSNEPMLDLVFAIALPSIGSALLFYIGASSGGTDVVAMIFQKYTRMRNIGVALFITDLIMIIAACFVFDIKTALYSFVGLTVKAFMIDRIIDNMKIRKSVTIICDDAECICDFINNTLKRGATIIEGKGAYTNTKKYVVFTTLNRAQALDLHAYIHQNQLCAFISIASTSEVFGNGFSAL